MVERDNATIRTIAWSEVFPWLSIARAFRIAISARALILAALGVLLTTIGWFIIGNLFDNDSPSTRWLEKYTGCPWKAAVSSVDFGPTFPCMSEQPEPGFADSQNCETSECYMTWSENNKPQGCPALQSDKLHGPICGPWSMLTKPALEGISHTALPLRAVVAILLCGIWGTAVWAFFGAAICRIAAVQLAADEKVGLGPAVRFAARKWAAYFAAPMFPVGGVLLAAIPVLILGWIMLSGFGLVIAGLVWPLALAAGLIMAILLLGLLFGWPLMWATISTEGSDSFDALSRSYAYTFQRPLHYIFYAAFAAFIGLLGWILVKNFAAAVIWMAYWSAGWGTGIDRLDSITGLGDSICGTGRFGVGLIYFWTGCIKLLAVGYLFSYFWAAAAAIYLLLRRDVDATETDEVFLDSDNTEEKFGLPTIAADQSGAPVASDQTASNEDAE